MKKNVFALWRTMMLVALVPVLSVGLVACEPENVEEGSDEDLSTTLPSGEAVDLGLSVKWASCNVGATSPEEYGCYFAWGETKTKISYTESNSVTYGLSTEELESRGIIGSDGNLTAAYDAATVNWGSSWRMPTSDEIKELLNNCTWVRTSQNGVNGRKITGPNGNSIFLPNAGCRLDTLLNSSGSGAFYWSATPDSDSSSDAYDLHFYLGVVVWGTYVNRSVGRSVRPVSVQ